MRFRCLMLSANGTTSIRSFITGCENRCVGTQLWNNYCFVLRLKIPAKNVLF